MATHQFPDDFKCPISLEIMSDPVILSSGHTFDRSSIQRWLDSGNRTCPITQLPLPPHPSLIPNHALRSLISTFTLASSPKSPSYPSPLSLLSSLSSPSLSSQLDSLRQLHSLSKHNPSFRREITESGAISVVLRCLSASNNKALQEAALAVLFDLSLDDDNKVGVVAEGGIAHIVAALREGTPNCRALAATTLTSLAVVEVNKGTIGDDPFAIRALVSLLRDGKGRGKREAATALYTLCSFPENKWRAVESGAVPVLLELADSGVERAVEVLGLLGKCREGREEMGRINGCVEVLVRVLRNGSSRSVEHALSALNSVCGYCELMGSEARSEGVLEICFGLVGDENLKIGRNASSLIQTLQRCRTVG
ncbi:U-box domain-containing protein 8 [Magnolia sinica]|uniref:U-box domain-containing protein 8 n=1 Tax=Magnolia sinica TaxID=86752 RepID=UPI002657D8D0|nr:U-box domain-containing protein 8 [Magnolia sinica]